MHARRLRGTFIAAYFCRPCNSAWENDGTGRVAIRNLLFGSASSGKVADKSYLCFLRDGEGEFFVGCGIIGCHVGAPRRNAVPNGTVKGSDRTPRWRRPITSKIPASDGFALSWRKEDTCKVKDVCPRCNVCRTADWNVRALLAPQH